MYDLISRYFSLDILSKNVIRFYIKDVTQEDDLEDLIKKVNFKKISSWQIAAYSSSRKEMLLDYNKFDNYFLVKQISLPIIKNRVLLQIIEHELDHAFMYKIRSTYNVLSQDYRRQMQIKEFSYFVNSLKCESIIRFCELPLSFCNMYSEYRANTFGYLKSLKKIGKKYSRFFKDDLEKRIFDNTFLNIINFYTYKDRPPYEIQKDIYNKLSKKQFKNDHIQEFIPESLEKTKELFDEEFSDEVLFELHRIMIGDQTIKDYELKEKMDLMNGTEMIESIRNKK